MADIMLFKANRFMVKEKSIPTIFAGKIIRETQKAMQIAGQGILTKKINGMCCFCGRELTNPNSITLGIGPICAANHNIPVLEGYTDKDIEKEVKKIKFTEWFPKSCIETLKKIKVDVQIETPKEKETVKAKKELIQDKDNIKIFFPYDADLLKKIKTLSGRKYNPNPKPHWTCPNTTQNKEKLKIYGFDTSVLTEIKKNHKSIEIPSFPAHLVKILFPYQKEGVKFIFEKNGRAIIGDEMGLGKTIQALTYLEMNETIKKALIICPASLKLNWYAEVVKWMSKCNVYVLNGRKTDNINSFQIQKAKNAKTIYIINYDILPAWENTLLNENIDCMVADECHYFKNSKTKRTKSIKNLNKHIEKFIALSGTPFINRPIEFFNALNMVNDTLFSSFWNYAQTYCGAVKNRFGWDFSGATNTNELNKIVQNIMIRRKKSDVLTELPEKTRHCIPLEITNRKTYEKAEENLISFLIENENLDTAMKAKEAETLVKIEKLKQLIWKGKKKAALLWVKEYLNIENKLVLFATHTKVLDFFQENFKDICVRIDGQTKMNDRDQAVKSFQNDENIKLFLGNIKAAGVGLTLTASKATCFVEFGWTPGEHDQAEDRVHRIGQTAKNVDAYYLVGDKSIDLDIMELLDTKRKVLDSVLDGKQHNNFSLIDLLKNK